VQWSSLPLRVHRWSLLRVTIHDGELAAYTTACEMPEMSEPPQPSPSTPIASWTIPTEQAATHFRPTTRLRGMHFPLRWTGVPPTGDHVRVAVRITGPEGAVLETDATIPTR
jgi:hypothetical protein